MLFGPRTYPCPPVCSEEDGRKYLIMQRLGDNLSSLRRMRQGRRFTFKTSVIAAIKVRPRSGTPRRSMHSAPAGVVRGQ